MATSHRNAGSPSPASTTTAGRTNLIRLFGSSDTDCGYCKGARSALVGRTREDCSRAYTIVAENLEPSTYEALLCRGWRRSGVLLYKPDNWQSCCPAITIRLPVQRFQPTKTQKKILKQMKSLLNPPVTTGTAVPVAHPDPKSREVELFELLQRHRVMKCLEEGLVKAINEVITEHWPERLRAIPTPSFKLQSRGRKARKRPDLLIAEEQKGQVSKLVLWTCACAAVAGQSKGTIDRSTLSQKVRHALSELFPVGFQLQTFLSQSSEDQAMKGPLNEVEVSHKRHRVESETDVSVERVDHHENSGQIFIHLAVTTSDVDNHHQSHNQQRNIDDMKQPPKSATEENHGDRFAHWYKASRPNSDWVSKPPYQLEVTTVPALESALDPSVHRLYWLYQTKVHGDPDPFMDDGMDDNADAEIEPWATGKLHDWREKALGMLDKEYHHLPQKKQTRVIKAFISFFDFLVEHPFVETTGARLGSFHQHYRIADGLLVAVGVVDILPTGLSSVYLYYDPSFATSLVPLGKYSILREIEWTQQAKLPYYYLGYYIESCPKMIYKADYHPSELLCPTTYRWVDAKQAIRTIQTLSPTRHCCTLAQQSPDYADDTREEPTCVDSALNMMRMELGQDTTITLSMLTPDGQEFVRPLLRDFVEAAGPQIALECIIDFR